MRWFKPVGFLFVPVSVMGWLVTAAAIVFCAQIFLFVDARSHSVSDTLYGIFPFWPPPPAWPRLDRRQDGRTPY